MANKGKAGAASKDQTAAAADGATTGADAATETGVTSQPDVTQSGEQVTAGAGTDDQVGSSTSTTEAATNTGVTNQPEGVQDGSEVTAGTATDDQAVFDALATISEGLGQAAASVTEDVLQAVMPESVVVGPVGYIVRCHRDRGIWRAGRFWPPENVPVRANEITTEQLEALRAEPLLSVLDVKE